MVQKIGFIYWNGKRRKSTKCPGIYMPQIKKPLLFEFDCMNHMKKPFFSIQNARGTVISFIDALKKNAPEEAWGYISKLTCDFFDMEEIKDMFQNIRQYHCLTGPYIPLKKGGISNISVAAATADDTEFIHLQMIEEPNCYGKWKIIKIEKK